METWVQGQGLIEMAEKYVDQGQGWMKIVENNASKYAVSSIRQDHNHTILIIRPIL